MLRRPVVLPEGFVLGSATAAHQIEGANRWNDWWAHEHAADTSAREPSGEACGHWERFRDDFRLLRELGQRAHRLSIEWSRIEPSEGEIDRAALDHYREVLGTLRDLGIEPWVTLHHFTTPAWLAARGGFANEANLEPFARFVGIAGRAFGDLVKRWCTINEPTIVAEMGYRYGYFPPRKQDAELSRRVLRNFFHAHALACAALRATASPADVGITLAVQAQEPFRPDVPGDVALARRRDLETNEVSFRALATGRFGYPDHPPEEIPGLADASTFVGIQYYTRQRLDSDSGWLAAPEPGRFVSQMGWEVYPEGLPPLLARASATGLPVVVTENGICCDDDAVRVRYVADHLAAVDHARRGGADVRGYFYWSTMDNFEWNFGYGPTFGLVAIDRRTLERHPRPSAYFFREVCRHRGLDEDLVARFS